MDIKPFHDRVVLKRIAEPQKGLIVVPDAHKEPSTLCEVVAVGPGRWKEDETGYRWFEATVVKPGQQVVIGPYTDLDLENGLVICQEADIRGIVEPKQVSRCA